MNLDEYGLPVVPKGWEVKPFRRVFSESSEVNGPTPHGPMLSVSSYRGIEVKDYSHDSQRRTDGMVENYRVVRPGQLVVNTMWLNYGGLGMSSLDGHVSPAYRAYSVTHHQSLRFLNYLLRSTAYIALYTKFLTGIRPNSLQMSRDELMKVPVLLPPLAEQECIADYLDRETATIDALIEKQRALVGALRERRSAAVEHALEAAADRGLLLKRLVSRVDQGISPDTSSATGLEDIWVLKSGASNDGFFNEEASKPVPESVTVPLEIELHEGDLVVSRASGSPRLVGSAAIVGQLSRRLVLSDKNFRLVPSQNVWVRYLYWALNSQIYREQVLRSISGAEGLANNLPLSKLMNFTVPVPPLEEQREIADHLDRETAKIDALIAKAERFIELAQERRAALITAAVTGQTEIPTED